MKEFDNPINKHFINACELLAQEFCKTLDVSYHKDDCHWVDYGNTFAFQAGEMFIDACDMMLVVENKMDYDAFSEWYYQWIAYDEKTGEPLPHRINLNSWLMGARPKL